MPGNLVKLLSTKMGNTKSKPKTKDHRPKSNFFTEDSRSDIQSDGPLPYQDYRKEDAELNRLRRSIKNNPEGFILNNLMMCVEFFKNYDEEISQMRKTLVSPRETTLNTRLLPQKRVLLPDVLQERIASNVSFISRRETTDPTVEPLQPVRIFVVYDNIEVSDEHDSSQYSTMSDTITYNMRLKPSTNQGYVHLQRIGITPSKRNPNTEEEVDLSSIAEDGHEFLSVDEGLYDPSQSRSLSPQSCVRSPTSRSNMASSKLATSKSMPDLLNDESPATSVHDSILPAGRNKLPLEFSNDYKDDTDYGAMSESRSIQSQSTVSKRDLGSQRRGVTRNSRHYSRGKIRSTSASPASSTSSGYKSGNYDTDIEYAYSTAKTYNSKPIPLDASEIPDSCFCQVTYTPDDRIYDPIEDRKKHIISSKERRVQVERNRRNYDVWYLSSSRFRRRFYNVFVESLALPLDLEEVIRYRRPYSFGSVIYCDKVEVSTTAKCNISESYEIIPCVWTQWPECANEWLERSRNAWPNYEMINNIRKSGCYIIPQEFWTKEDKSNYKTEWQLAFPAAERYLETCMSHAQMRVYVIVLMLHKTFIRAVESAPDRLNTHQIRNQLFWLMERTQSEWVENMTGDYLVKLLNCLCNCINNNPFLKDYFLQEKNLFKNSEKNSLFFSLKQLKRILDNPVMYVLHAMENIRYKSKFFPKLNYEELLRILTAEELLLINPNLETKVNNFALMQDPLEDDETYKDRRGFWDDAKKKKEQFSTYSKKSVTNRTLINPSKAHESVVDIAIRCGELKGIRLSKLLNFFIGHLIKMARKYQEYGALQQKIDYLHHAMSLSILLAEDAMFKEEAQSHIREISDLKKQVIHSRSQNEPPETPKRNAETSNFSSFVNNRSSDTSSISFSNDEASASFQMEPFESTMKISDSSIFSQPLKDRYSSISNRPSLPLPTTNESSSQNSSPQMKKKSDPPVYMRALKDRYSITASERSSASLPAVDEKKESDVTSPKSSSVCVKDSKVLSRSVSVKDKIRALEEKKEEDSLKTKNTEEKKKDPQESKVISLTDKDEDTLHDTYI